MDRQNREQWNRDIETWIADHREQMIEDIITLVNIKSVKTEKEGIYTFGRGVGKALDKALKMADQAGFETLNDNYYYGIARLNGTGQGKIGIFTHLDVVPEGNGWEYEPYQAVVKDGYIIGRGTGDNKGPLLAALNAMKFIKEHHIVLSNTVELYLGCAEEAGMEDISYYMEQNTPPQFSFTPDVAFPVSFAEKGILELTAQTVIEQDSCLTKLSGGLVSNMVASEAYAVLKSPDEKTKAYLKSCDDISVEDRGEEITVQAQGIGKHAAFPEGSRNAIAILANALEKVEELGEKTKRALSFLSKTLEDYYGESLGISYQDEVTGRLTHTCGVLSTDGTKMEVNFNIRYPVETPAQEMKQRLQDQFEASEFHITELHDNPPVCVPLESSTVQKLNEICNENLGTDFKPYSMGGGTYARKLPNAVGYGPGRSDSPLKWGNGHEPDECVKIENLEHAIRIYIKALIELDKMI